MVYIFVTLIAFIGYKFPKLIRKFDKEIIVFSTLISLISILEYELLESNYFNTINSGFLGLEFLIVVMFTGALKKGSILNKRLRSIRKEFSILGFIFILPHAYIYLYEYFINAYSIDIWGILAFIVMIPLFHYSFSKFKKKIPIKKWYEIQEWAYLVYFFIFLHLVVIGSEEYTWMYYTIFFTYLTLKLKNYVFVKHAFPKAYIVTSILLCIMFFSFDNFPIENNTGFTLYSPITSNVENPYTLNASSTVALTRNYRDGTYTSSASGYKRSTVSVEVIILDGIIDDINILNCGCTGGKYTSAVNSVVNKYLSGDTEIDSVSGATYSTNGVINAINQALNDAN